MTNEASPWEKPAATHQKTPRELLEERYPADSEDIDDMVMVVEKSGETEERDTTSPDYLIGLKHAQTISAEQFGRLVVADPEGDEVRDFMRANGLEFGDDVVVTIEDGRTVVMGTDREDFGTTDRMATAALGELLAQAPESVETHSEAAQAGIEDMGETAAKLTVEIAEKQLSAKEEVDAIDNIAAKRAVKDYEMYMSTADANERVNGRNRDAEESRKRARDGIATLPTAMQDLARRYYKEMKLS